MATKRVVVRNRSALSESRQSVGVAEEIGLCSSMVIRTPMSTELSLPLGATASACFRAQTAGCRPAFQKSTPAHWPPRVTGVEQQRRSVTGAFCDQTQDSGMTFYN
jgi:hypothetical protein